MFGKREYLVSGTDFYGTYVEKVVWASSAKEALKTAQDIESKKEDETERINYTTASKKGCGCGGRRK